MRIIVLLCACDAALMSNNSDLAGADFAGFVPDLAVSSISTRQPTLDDVYLQLTGARLADAA